jgi:phosphohistidine phosphatase SixA
MMVNRERYRRDRRSLVRLAAVLIVAVALSPVVGHGTAAPAPATEAAWEALRAGGTVALIRHALAPGTGDPPGFALGDCATQRNLSDEGRAQAARLGEAFRAHGVAVDRVLSSGWCRCLDTALLAFGAAEVWPPLHSFFGDPGTEPARTAEARAGVASWTGPGTLVLVTHQVNITALTGIVPESGEVIALVPAPDQPAGFVVAGRITIR